MTGVWEGVGESVVLESSRSRIDEVFSSATPSGTYILRCYIIPYDMI